MKVAVHGYRAGCCAFVLEWNLPFRNPGSATVAKGSTTPYNLVHSLLEISTENLQSFEVYNL